MNEIGFYGLLLVFVNIIVSFIGFRDLNFFEKHTFVVDKVLVEKDYKRIISSGFLHVGWVHLIFNIVSLYSFAGLLEYRVGHVNFLIIYFASMIGGKIFALFVHRNHGDYSSVGASGAVCGVIFATIAVIPGMNISLFGLPFSLPSWLYGLFFLVISIYGVKNKSGNVGHESHLAGALVGMIISLIILPASLTTNYIPIVIVLMPTLVFIYMIITRPEILITGSFSGNSKRYYNIDERYNAEKFKKQKELDRILDKINHKGMNSLSERERKKLEELSG
ncbi:MAG: rhomboid family intramembrane serine protease [Cytophagaceae bacterium]